MKKKTIFTALLFMAATPILAHNDGMECFSETVEYNNNESNIETKNFWNNCFVSVGAGPQVYFGDHDRQRKFGERISPALDIALGKWFTPVIGVRLMYSGLFAKGATQNGAYQSGGPISGKPWHGYWLSEQKFKYFDFHVDAMFNVTNLFWRENDDCIYDLSPYAGIGVARVTDKPKNVNVIGHLGLMNSFRINEDIDVNLDLRSAFINDGFDGETGGRGSDFMLTLSLGLTYKF